MKSLKILMLSASFFTAFGMNNNLPTLEDLMGDQLAEYYNGSLPDDIFKRIYHTNPLVESVANMVLADEDMNLSDSDDETPAVPVHKKRLSIAARRRGAQTNESSQEEITPITQLATIAIVAQHNNQLVRKPTAAGQCQSFERRLSERYSQKPELITTLFRPSSHPSHSMELKQLYAARLLATMKYDDNVKTWIEDPVTACQAYFEINKNNNHKNDPYDTVFTCHTFGKEIDQWLIRDGVYWENIHDTTKKPYLYIVLPGALENRQKPHSSTNALVEMSIYHKDTPPLCFHRAGNKKSYEELQQRFDRHDRWDHK